MRTIEMCPQPDMRFDNEKDKREYIAIGKYVKLSLAYNIAPRCWNYEAQAYFNYIANIYQYRFAKSS